MKKWLRLVPLLILLLPMVVVAQNPTSIFIRHDTTLDPFCTATLTADCVKGARIFKVDAQGNLTSPLDVPASAFQPVTGSTTLFEAVVAISSLTAQRYGSFNIVAEMVALDPLGAEVLSVPSATKTVLKRPIPPAGFDTR